jgi:uncharacterized protein (TIGR02996 family)
VITLTPDRLAEGILLMRAIRVDPLDPTPRLAFADWLAQYADRPGIRHRRPEGEPAAALQDAHGRGDCRHPVSGCRAGPLEMFARTRRPGWDGWGDECPESISSGQRMLWEAPC